MQAQDIPQWWCVLIEYNLSSEPTCGVCLCSSSGGATQRVVEAQDVPHLWRVLMFEFWRSHTVGCAGLGHPMVAHAMPPCRTAVHTIEHTIMCLLRPLSPQDC